MRGKKPVVRVRRGSAPVTAASPAPARPTESQARPAPASPATSQMMTLGPLPPGPKPAFTAPLTAGVAVGAGAVVGCAGVGGVWQETLPLVVVAVMFWGLPGVASASVSTVTVRALVPTLIQRKVTVASVVVPMSPFAVAPVTRIVLAAKLGLHTLPD